MDKLDIMRKASDAIFEKNWAKACTLLRGIGVTYRNIERLLINNGCSKEEFEQCSGVKVIMIE